MIFILIKYLKLYQLTKNLSMNVFKQSLSLFNIATYIFLNKLDKNYFAYKI